MNDREQMADSLDLRHHGFHRCELVPVYVPHKEEARMSESVQVTVRSFRAPTFQNRGQMIVAALDDSGNLTLTSWWTSGVSLNLDGRGRGFVVDMNPNTPEPTGFDVLVNTLDGDSPKPGDVIELRTI